MKIEIDTQTASREELYHLAQMIMAITNRKKPGKHANIFGEPENRRVNIFDDDSPEVPMFGNSGSSSPSGSSAATQSASDSSDGLFSMFNNDSSASSPTTDSSNSLEAEEEKEEPKIEFIF